MGGMGEGEGKEREGEGRGWMDGGRENTIKCPCNINLAP